MPAVSKSQQKLMGMVHAYNKGELGSVSPSLLKKIKNIAKSLKKKDAKDFAKTTHEGLPAHIKKKKNKKADILNDMIKLANILDEKGLIEEADFLDYIIQDVIG